MGRIAGVSPEETRDRLLESAASVFAHRGYDGATTSEIASDAGVSSGSIYAHFGSKADLFVAALHSHGSEEVARLLEVDVSGADVVRLITERGLGLRTMNQAKGSLLVEAIVAARRHPEVADLLRAAFSDREAKLSGLLGIGQRDGSVDGGLPAAAVSRFVLIVLLGSLLVGSMDLPPVSEDDWAVLIGTLVGRLRTS